MLFHGIGGPQFIQPFSIHSSSSSSFLYPPHKDSIDSSKHFYIYPDTSALQILHLGSQTWDCWFCPNILARTCVYCKLDGWKAASQFAPVSICLSLSKQHHHKYNCWMQLHKYNCRSTFTNLIVGCYLLFIFNTHLPISLRSFLILFVIHIKR